MADNPLDVQQFVDILRAEIAQMILGNIGNQRNIRLVNAESAPQQTTSRGFQNCNIHILFAQDHACTARSRPVVTIDNAVIDRHPVSRTHADVAPAIPENVLCETDRRGFAVGAGHESGRHVMVFLPVQAVGRR